MNQLPNPSTFDPRPVWRRLTVLVRVALAVVLLSAGAWLGALLIPLRPVAMSERTEIFNDIREDLARRPSGLSSETLDAIAREVTDREVWRTEHRDRSRIQEPAQLSLIIGGVVFLISALVRKDPWSWDSTIPRIPLVGDALPSVLPGWHVLVEGPNRRSILVGCCHSVRAARDMGIRAAQQVGTKDITIKWDYGPSNAYHEYAARQPFL